MRAVKVQGCCMVVLRLGCARVVLLREEETRGVYQLYVVVGLVLAFMDLGRSCSIIWVVVFEIRICMHGLEVVASPSVEYDQCLAAMLVSSQALVGDRSI